MQKTIEELNFFQCRRTQFLPNHKFLTARLKGIEPVPQTWNIQGIHHQVEQIKEFENFSFWQRLNSFIPFHTFTFALNIFKGFSNFFNRQSTYLSFYIILIYILHINIIILIFNICKYCVLYSPPLYRIYVL